MGQSGKDPKLNTISIYIFVSNTKFADRCTKLKSNDDLLPSSVLVLSTKIVGWH